MAEAQPRNPAARQQREMAKDQKEKLEQAESERRAQNEGSEESEGSEASSESEQDIDMSSRSDEALIEAWQHFHSKGNTTLVPDSPEAIEVANIRSELDRRGLLS